MCSLFCCGVRVRESDHSYVLPPSVSLNVLRCSVCLLVCECAHALVGNFFVQRVFRVEVSALERWLNF